MNIKKLLLTSMSAALIGGVLVSVPGTDYVLSQAQTVSAQEAPEVSPEQVQLIKDNVAGYQPVNLEQLLQVADADLVAYYNAALEDPTITDDTGVWEYVYQQIAQNYPELGLPTGEDYDAYYRVASALTDNSPYTFSDLNMAEPSQTLSLYRQAMSENNDNVEQTVVAILPTIDQRIAEYETRRAERESQGGNNPESSQISQTVSDESVASDESTETVESGSQESASDESTPEESTPSIDVQAVRGNLIAQTPILPSQLEQITDERLSEYAESYKDSENPTRDIFNQIVGEYPTLFQSEIHRFKETLVNEQGLNAESLDQSIHNYDLLWLEYSVYVDNNGQENFDMLADRLVNEYGVAVDEPASSESSSTETSSSQETPVEDETVTIAEINQLLLNNTPMTQDQLSQIPAETLITFAEEGADMDNTAEHIYNATFVNFPEVFAPEADHFRQILVEEHNINEESLAQLSDADLLWAEYNVYLNNNGQENMNQLASTLVNNYGVTVNESESREESTTVDSIQGVEENNAATDVQQPNTELTPGASVESASTVEESSSVSARISSGVETNDTESLPNTGERNTIIITVLALVVLAIAGYFIYTGYKSNKEND